MGEDGGFGAEAVGPLRKSWRLPARRIWSLWTSPQGCPTGTVPRAPATREARRLVGPRRSSLFPPPARAALGAAGYAAACAQNRDATGRAISRQAWGLAPRIAQVDAALRARPPLQACCREAHPEVGFCALNG